MERTIGRTSVAIEILAFAATLFVVFFTDEKLKSAWFPPLLLLSIVTLLAGVAYGGRHAGLLPKSASRVFFWLLLVALVITTSIFATV